ncbi:ATP-binding protein [Streptomyces sp. NPDC051555]|uniref:ATP-binding protein n=1 Tax=Streptomyces sp. NPDC051555 TaxID=3365657 RepID=UPI0037A9A8E9
MPHATELLDRVRRADGPPPARHHAGLSATDLPARAVRRFAADILRPLATDAVQDISLVADELVANAETHACGAACLFLEVYGDAVVLTVCDRGPGVHSITARQAGPDETNGRGLALVAALLAAWFTQPAPSGGALVTAVFDLSPKATRCSPPI